MIFAEIILMINYKANSKYKKAAYNMLVKMTPGQGDNENGLKPTTKPPLLSLACLNP